MKKITNAVFEIPGIATLNIVEEGHPVGIQREIYPYIDEYVNGEITLSDMLQYILNKTIVDGFVKHDTHYRFHWKFNPLDNELVCWCNKEHRELFRKKFDPRRAVTIYLDHDMDIVEIKRLYDKFKVIETFATTKDNNVLKRIAGKILGELEKEL